MTIPGLRINPEELAKLPASVQQQVAEQLGKAEELYRQNPLLGFEPHDKQVEFLSPPFPPLRFFAGGNRSGKTSCVIVYALINCIDADQVPAPLKQFRRWRGPVRCRVVTPDLTSTLGGVIHEKIREYCPPGQLKGGGFDRAFDKVQRVLTFKNGSWIQFNSSEQDREKLGGTALHIVIYDEEPRQEVRNECLTRLIDYDGEELFALTPFSGMKWLFDEIYDPWERGELRSEDGRVVVVDMDDNPHLSESGKARALSQYSESEREARKSGRFVAFSGLIYPRWEQAIVPAIQRVPPGAEVFVGIDPGIRHMCAVLFGYLDAEDDMVIFDEIALRDGTFKDACDQIKRLQMRWGAVKDDGTRDPLRYRWAVIDPAAKNRTGQTGRSDQMEFQEHGVATIPGQNDVRPGINRVLERLNAGRLHVTANCVELQKEFKRYRWVMDTGRGEGEAREAPVKKDDHLLDALRYMVMQRPMKPERPVAPESMTQRDRLLRHHLRRLKSRARSAPAGSSMGPGQWS